MKLVQVVSFIERASLWRTPPIFYPCVLELLKEPEKAAETARYLQDLLSHRTYSTSEEQQTENCYKCDGMSSGMESDMCETTATTQRMLRRCIRSRAAASLLVCSP